MFLFRHPEAEHNLQKGYFDHADSLPTPLGELQAPEVIDFLASERITFLALSNRQRAQLTIVNGDYGQPHVPPVRAISAAFADLDWGDWAGQKISEVISKEVQDEIDEAGVDFVPPGGQSFRQKGEQFLAGLDNLQHPQAVIAHQLAIATAVGTALGWSRDEIRNFKMGHGEGIYFNPDKPRDPERVFMPEVTIEADD